MKQCCHPLILGGVCSMCPLISLDCLNCMHYKKKQQRHPHADLIIAWANGAKIQVRDLTNYCDPQDCVWKDFDYFDDEVWTPEWEYRIKPEPKPDVSYICEIKKPSGNYSPKIISSYQNEVPVSSTSNANCKLVFDGETGKLKSVEIV